MHFQTPYDLIYAPVLNRGAERWVKALTIGAGTRAGVRPGMAVMGPAGLAGGVARVTADAAEVELLTSERLRVAASHAPSGATAVYYADAAGTGHLDYLPRATDLATGDLVVTSVTSGLYPPGLVIGHVRAFRRPYDSMFAEVDVALAQDPARLEYVFVVNRTPERR